jgi:hypothetical protein
MLDRLPQKVQEEAREGFARWKEDPRSVGFKHLTGMSGNVWSVQIGNRYRALGVVSKEHNAIAWMFVGSHEDYNQFIEVRRQMSQKGWLGGGLRERLEARRGTTAPIAKAPSSTSRLG